jgi:hypothetical protein
MKRILFSLLLAAAGISASAMNARDAREYAYFLTDKMAYELNLTPLQYERVYEVNLDHFLAINSPYNIDRYQEYRDDDLRYILSERQYWDYINANYFYRPLSWGRGSWVFNIYNRYSYRNNYYFGRPSCYDSYEGSNWALRLTSARSPYWGISFDFRFGGMRDSYVRYYNTPISVQPYQREPLIILDSRYGGNSRSGYDNQRYGYSNNGYYVSPSSRHYGYDYGSRNYGVQQRRVDLYEGRRSNAEYNRGIYDDNRSYDHGNYNLNRNNNGYQPYNRQDSRVNYGNNYDSGRRGTGAFSQPQRDSRSNMEARPENSNQESSRQVNGTTIVGGRR